MATADHDPQRDPEGLMTVTARKRNSRRLILEQLKALKKNAGVMVNTWSKVPSLTYFTGTDGTHRAHSGAEARTRADVPASEYSENDPAKLRRLIEFAQVMERQAAYVKHLAMERLDEIEGTRADA